MPLIRTKIRIPRRRMDLLSRRRLVDFVHAHLDRKLILISAPAGYGKTSLLTDFAHDTDLPVCWYTLDPFDRDLNVFLEHLIAAIARKFPAFGERSRAFLSDVTNPGRNLYPMVATLVQEIYDAIPEYFVLVLDDHHAVEDQELINEFLDLFVTYVDENCHLVIASRTLPALPSLSLLVARRQAAGLSIDELRFTPQEIQALAHRNYELELSFEQAETFAERSGGWITGLLLTAVPEWEKSQAEAPVRGSINVSLDDFYSRQVLSQQPAPLRAFLLESSVLDELSPSLCTEVLGTENTAELMEQVRSRNLFIIEYEGLDAQLRYHDLFRDFLQTSLRRENRDRYRELTRRAANAYATRGEWERAVSRFLALGEYESAADIIQKTALEQYDAGHWDTLASWIDALPEPIRAERPRFLVYRGNIHMERGELTAALALCGEAEKAYEAAGDKIGLARTLATESVVLRVQGQYGEALAHCDRALTLISGVTSREKAALALAHRNAALCHFRMGGLAEGRQSLMQALRLYEELDDRYDVALANHDLGLGYELAGDLQGAARHYRAALQSWQELGIAGPWANTLNGLGVVYYLQGKYDEALDVLNDALNRAQQGGDLRVEGYAWASLGDLHRDLGAYDRALKAYKEGLEAAQRGHAAFVVTYSLDALGNTLRLEGKLHEAREHLQEALKHAEEHRSGYEAALCHTSLGILAGVEGDLATAEGHLAQAIETFEAGGFQRDLARAVLQQAQLAFLARKRDMALDRLRLALAQAQQLGSDQFLVVDGLQIQPLLRFAQDQGLATDVLPELLARIEAHKKQMATQPEAPAEAESAPTLMIHAFGQPWVDLEGERVQWATAQSRDVFFCLLQHPEGLRKEELGEIFWPEHSPAKLEGIFRSTLYRLRRALFRESVVFEDGVYRFNWQSDYWYDAEAFEMMLDQADHVKASAPERAIVLLEEAIALYHSDYLENVYGDWCEQEQRRLHGRYLVALETLAWLYTERRELQQAIELYQRLLTLDQYREAAHRGLMNCYYRLGNRAAAIRQYQTCAEALREDLGLSPTKETETLYRQIID